MTESTPATGVTKDVEIATPLTYLINIWRTLEMPLIDCEINLILTWSANCVISVANGATTFAITDAKRYFLNPRQCNAITTIENKLLMSKHQSKKK